MVNSFGSDEAKKVLQHLQVPGVWKSDADPLVAKVLSGAFAAIVRVHVPFKVSAAALDYKMGH